MHEALRYQKLIINACPGDYLGSLIMQIWQIYEVL